MCLSLEVLNSPLHAVNAQVAVVGAAGGIGQPMSLLMKLSGKIEHLSLFDIVNTPGVAADLSHCNSKGKVRWLNSHGHVRPLNLCAEFLPLYHLPEARSR